MRRLAVLLALGLALIALPAYADDGSGCRYPDPTAGVEYGDINVR